MCVCVVQMLNDEESGRDREQLRPGAKLSGGPVFYTNYFFLSFVNNIT